MSVAWYTHTSIAVTSIVVTSRGRHRHRALPPLARPLVPPRAPPPLAPPTCPSSCPSVLARTRADCLHRGRLPAPRPQRAAARKRSAAHLPPRAAEKASDSPLAATCCRESTRQPVCHRVPPRKRLAAHVPPRAKPITCARTAEKAPGSPLAVACRRECAWQPACRHVPPSKWDR